MVCKLIENAIAQLKKNSFHQQLYGKCTWHYEIYYRAWFSNV
jgi:hypothetical protein